MPDKATMILEYRIAGWRREVRRRAEVFGWPNALRTERQYWIRLYDSCADGPTAIDRYGQNGAFIARTRFLKPAIERFFAFAPALAARLGRGLASTDRTTLEVRFETEMLFSGDIHTGTHFETHNPRFIISLGEKGELARFDAAHPPDAKRAGSRIVPGSIDGLLMALEAAFGESIADLLTSLPCFPED